MRILTKWLRRCLLLAGSAIGAVAVLGPREPVNTEVVFDGAAIGNDVDAYFAAQEANFDDIVEGAQKRVVWHEGVGQVTDIAVLYVHGFSATSEEIRPVPDNVAAALGANLVFTRMSGHGRSGAAMAEPRVHDWVQDVAEALAAARKVGREVIVISTSTGATMATILAAQPEQRDAIKAQIFVSPNFGVNHPAAGILTWPAVRWWGPIVAGRERSFEAVNAAHAKYWSIRYPTVALFPMAAAAKHARHLDHGSIQTPLLVLMSNDDRVVSPDATRAVMARWGGPTQRVTFQMTEKDDPHSHVIAGDVLSPMQTDGATKAMLDWIAGL